MGRGPKVDGEVVGGGDETFSDFIIDSGGFVETGSCEGDLGFIGCWWVGGDVAVVVMVGGAEDGVGGKGEMVDPVGMRGEGVG